MRELELKQDERQRELVRELELKQDERQRGLELKLQQNVYLPYMEILSYVKVSSVSMSPSSDCVSSAEHNYTTLMNTLRLPSTMSLLTLSIDGHTVEGNAYGPFSYSWGDAEEATAYGPLATYLRESGLAVEVVSNGQTLPHGNLFNVDVHTLREKLGVRSSELRLTNSEPRYKLNLKGRTDLIVLSDPTSTVSRVNVRYCIEVKTVKSMTNDGDINRSLREAVLQLIGMNVNNDYASPSVILTNLNGKHFVLYLSMGPDDPHTILKFNLNIRKFSSFHQALFFADQVPRNYYSRDFGSPATPPEGSRSDAKLSDGEEEFKNAYLSAV